MITSIKKVFKKYILEIAVAAMIGFMILFCAAVVTINLCYGF